MPRNGSGTYTLPEPSFVPNTTISSAAVNSDLSDIATALTDSISSDGQTPIAAPIQFTTGTATAPGITFVGNTTYGVFLVDIGGEPGVGITTDGVTSAFFDSSNFGTGQNGFCIFNGFGAGLNPVGMIVDYAGNNVTPGAGWYLCNGQALSRTNYPECFAVIGTTFGAGDGSTTFNLPNTQGLFTIGVDAGVGVNLGSTGGSYSATIEVANLPDHSHSFSAGVSISDPGHSHGVNDSGHFHTYTEVVTADTNLAAGPTPGGPSGATSADTGTSTTGISIQNNTTGISASVSGTTGGTGSGVALTTTPPYIGLNKIIFVGRP